MLCKLMQCTSDRQDVLGQYSIVYFEYKGLCWVNMEDPARAVTPIPPYIPGYDLHFSFKHLQRKNVQCKFVPAEIQLLSSAVIWPSIWRNSSSKGYSMCHCCFCQGYSIRSNWIFYFIQLKNVKWKHFEMTNKLWNCDFEAIQKWDNCS